MKFLKQSRAVMLSLLLLTGCGGQQTSPAVTPTEAPNYEDDIITDEEIRSMQTKTEYTDQQEQLLAQKVSLTDAHFVDSLTDVAAYPALACVPMEDALQRLAALPELDEEPKYGLVTNLPLDADALYERVRKNTDALAAAGTHGKTVLNEEDMRFCCEYICKTLNEELPKLAYTDQLDDIDANLANLSMFEGIGLTHAAIVDDGTMTFSRTLSENMLWVSGFEQTVEKTIAHETEHLMQKTSNAHRDALGLERSYGFMAVWEDMEMDPLMYVWMIEAAAERLASNLYQTDPETYLTKVGYLDSLAFVTMLDGYHHDAVARTTQQSEFAVLYEMFRCETPEEQAELRYLLYAIEVIQEEPEGFLAAYARETGVEMTESQLVNLKINLKVSLLSTLSRYFYRNLAYLVTAEDLTLEEVLFLISGWEMDLHAHIGYTDTTRQQTIRPFLETYQQLQQDFFAQIAPSLQTDVQSLTQLHAVYNANIPNANVTSIFEELNEPWEPVAVTGLGEENNAFLNHFLEKLSNQKSVTIAEHLGDAA